MESHDLLNIAIADVFDVFLFSYCNYIDITIAHVIFDDWKIACMLS